MEIIATNKNSKRKISASGKDIYAVTAPLVVEAVKRILENDINSKGVTTMGQVFNASNFLQSLSADDIIISPVEEERIGDS